jgi:proteasome alpha subunit
VSTPFYVSPEQLMKDRADYARKGIARGRSIAVLAYDGGILLVGENPSRALHKISEVYDRIAFAAAGKYNEYETLRTAGVRLADTRGYLYDRRDVNGRGLANAYAQTLGAIFSEPGGKPYEVELVIAEVGDRPDQDQIYRLTYDGSVAQVESFVVMGGPAEAVSAVLERNYVPGASLGAVLRVAVDALGRDGTEPRTIAPNQLEVAVLDRDRKQELADEPGAEEALIENGASHGGDEPAAGPAAGAGAVAAVEAEQLDVNDLIDEVLDGDDAAEADESSQPAESASSESASSESTSSESTSTDSTESDDPATTADGDDGTSGDDEDGAAEHE